MSSIFDKFTSSIKKVFGGSNVDSVVGIDIGLSYIKAVQVRNEAGRAILETYGSVATGPYLGLETGQIPQLKVEAVVQALRDLFQASNITTKKVILSVQSSSSLIFTISLPPVSDKQLAQVVPTEITKYIPVPLTEVSFDWWKIPPSTSHLPPDKVEVLVAAIRKETIRFYQTVLAQAGLEAVSFEIETFGGLRAVFSQELKPVALVDLGASSSRLAISEYGIVRKFHTINRGAEFLTNAISKSLQIPFARAERLKKELGVNGVADDKEKKSVIELLKTDTQYIIYEVQKALLSYEKEKNTVISKVMLSGGGALLPGIAEAFRKELSIDVQIADPIKRLGSTSFLAGNGIGMTEFTISVGVAIKNLK